MAASSSSKSPGWGSGSVHGSFFISATEDLTLAGSCLPARDDEPGRWLAGPFDDQRQRSPSIGPPDDEPASTLFAAPSAPAQIPIDHVAVVEELLGFFDGDRSRTELLHRGRRGQEFMDDAHGGYLHRAGKTARDSRALALWRRRRASRVDLGDARCGRLQ